MIEVIDNFAPQDYFELIQNHVLSWNQEWYYQANITAGVFGKEGLGKHGQIDLCLLMYLLQTPN